MANFSLGEYTFTLDPEEMTIPSWKKPVAEVKTYSGSAIFQWPAIIVGEDIEMFWTVMEAEQYDQLETFYLSPDEVTFDPNHLGTYQVIVKAFTGTYLSNVFNDKPYRLKVRMVLNIRSFTPSA